MILRGSAPEKDTGHGNIGGMNGLLPISKSSA